MKFNAPEGATSISVGGECFNVENGQIETPDHGEYVNLLAPHGFVVAAPEVAAAKPARAKKASAVEEAAAPEVAAETPAETPVEPAAE